ncbi:multidrug ABC transporter ATP-binding protein [Vibrio albus]|uniref:Multidrug ABC transporter ATP-binding protein n=1 Tax=Vibrio albus TaxID=2200953 RepID=A0A2U3B6R3_9VIBR|nr:ABC transporter ATP-binding protein [Vibrio albus]PWI32478.1 multidrug ABC transporter ATP-binding protein [Vibrio albus]
MFRWFENLTQAFPKHEPETPPNSLFAFCRYYTRGFEKPLLLLSVLSACVAVAEVTLVRYMGELVDILSSQSRENFWLHQGARITSMALLVMVVMPVLAFFHSMIMHQSILGNYPMSVRWQAHRHLLKQSVGFFQRDFSGRVATKVMQNANAIRETVMKMMDIMIYIAVYFVSVLFMLAEADQTLVLPVLIWLIIYIVIQFYFVPVLKKNATELADAQSNMTGRIVDSYTNIMTVKLFSHSQRETEFAETGMKYFLHVTYRQMRTITGLLFSLDILNYLLLLSTAALAIFLWRDELVSVGVIAIGITISLRLQGMSKWIMWEIRALFENIGIVIDSMNTIAHEAEVKDVPQAKDLQVTSGEIRFTAVNFRYDNTKAVFDGLNLHIKPGEKVGIVGRSGAGKSTLVNLLLRFYDINSGTIAIDGQGKTGLDVQVGERGVKLSGGQRQRIAIARVLLKDAPVLILDEATSALDSDAESAIQENLQTLMQDKTVIAIAHRLSTINSMDRLIVMDGGCIAEEGTHEELLESGGIYAQLWARQTGGFIG